MRKLIASGLAAALALTATPVASAQLSSSSSLFSSSSEAAPQQPDHVQDVEDAMEAFQARIGNTRVSEYDEEAESMLDDALAGKVTWYAYPNFPIEGLSVARYSDLRNNYGLIRFPHSAAEEAANNLRNSGDLDLGVYGPYGLAAGSDNNWVYLAFAEPRYI